jgi:hypothetical protein
VSASSGGEVLSWFWASGHCVEGDCPYTLCGFEVGTYILTAVATYTDGTATSHYFGSVICLLAPPPPSPPPLPPPTALPTSYPTFTPSVAPTLMPSTTVSPSLAAVAIVDATLSFSSLSANHFDPSLQFSLVVSLASSAGVATGSVLIQSIYDGSAVVDVLIRYTTQYLDSGAAYDEFIAIATYSPRSMISN